METGIIMVLKPKMLSRENEDHQQKLVHFYAAWAKKHQCETRILSEAWKIGDPIVMAIFGEGIFEVLKHETGNHRWVQTSPYDEKGRIHTTYTEVHVFNMPDKNDYNFSPEDVKIEVVPQNQGGQVAGIAHTPISITHLKTGLTALAFGRRSQIKTRECAMILLACKLQFGDYSVYKPMTLVRSYRFSPFVQIVDLRTDMRSSSEKPILDGDLEYFYDKKIH